MMKRSACLFLLAAMIAVPSAARAEDACEKIVMTGHPDYPAMAYRAGDRIDGAAPALVAAIAEDLGVPLVSRYLGSWSEAQEAAREGKADMIVGVYRNDEREKYLDYADPAFAYDTVVVFVVAGKSFEFRGQEDLVGKKGAANKGESFGAEFDRFVEDQLTMVRTDGVDAALAELTDGKVDYVIAGYYPGTAEVERLGLENEIVALEPELLSAELFVAFSKTSPCRTLVSKFGEGIAEMTTDGRFQEMVRDATTEWDAATSDDE